MEFSFDELNAGKFHWDDELHSDPKKFLSEELHYGKKRSDGKGYDFGLDEEIRTDMDDLDEEKVLEKVTEYFEPMGIPKERKETRIKKAMECDDDFLFMLYWIDRMRENGNEIPWDKILQECYKRILAVFKGQISNGTKLAIASDVADFVDVTKRHLGEPYYLSPERAVNSSLCVVSDVENCSDYEKDASGKKFKTWHTTIDGKERPSHRSMNGTTIAIDDQFVVGDSIMNYPRDMTFDPNMEEIANCRCWLTYK